MPEHKVGTRQEWQVARDELAKLEAEQAKRNEEITRARRDLPWVRVEKEYEFDTEDGKKTLAELFDGRSQLLAYNIMFGPDYTLGACPGCTSLGDGLDGSLVHLNHLDVTLICFSRAPVERLTAYKQRMGWQFPYVSTYNTDFAFDFGLALTEEQAQQVPEVKEMIDNPPEFLKEWSRQIGAELKDGLRENPSWIAFARENGTVYHTYTVSAPDPFVAPYFSFLLERTPKAQPDIAGTLRKDEYPDCFRPRHRQQREAWRLFGIGCACVLGEIGEQRPEPGPVLLGNDFACIARARLRRCHDEPAPAKRRPRQQLLNLGEDAKDPLPW